MFAFTFQFGDTLISVTSERYKISSGLVKNTTKYIGNLKRDFVKYKKRKTQKGT